MGIIWDYMGLYGIIWDYIGMIMGINFTQLKIFCCFRRLLTHELISRRWNLGAWIFGLPATALVTQREYGLFIHIIPHQYSSPMDPCPLSEKVRLTPSHHTRVVLQAVGSLGIIDLKQRILHVWKPWFPTLPIEAISQVKSRWTPP